MKKRYLFVSGAKRWNNLLAKFSKLQKRVELLSSNNNNSLYKRLVNKMESIFSKLEKMQYQTGIKLAGTTLAIVLSAFTANAQFAAGELLKYTGDIYEANRSSSTFADIDGDGDQDLYVGDNVGFVKIYTNDNGTYSETGTLYPSNPGQRAKPAFADIDNDGDLDLYVGDRFGKIWWFTNYNGFFTSQGKLQAGGTEIDVGDYAAPSFADIDNDGDLDLYVGALNGQIHEFINNSGTFSSPNVLLITGSTQIPAILGGFATPVFADLDNDGDLDLYAGNADGLVTLFTNNSGAFTYTNRVQINSSDLDVGDDSAPSFNDVDGDGDLDLYVNSIDSNIKIFTNNNGVFTAAGVVQNSNLTIDVGGYAKPTFADIDADGDLDLHIGEFQGEIKVFTNTNAIFIDSGDLQAGTTIDIGNNAAPTFADIDGDGDLDLYIGEYSGNVKSFTNNSGVFAAASDLVTGSGSFNDNYSIPIFADIDGDGDLDLYIGEYSGNVKSFINNNGVFTAAPDLVAGSGSFNDYYSAPTFADIDGDSDLDLYLGKSDGTIKVFTNSNGVFTANGNLQAAGVDIDVNNSSAPTFADIDGDGDLDLYVGNLSGLVTFYENTTPTTVGISENALKNVNIYPNPVQKKLFINLEEQEVTSIEIIDYSGKIVKKEANNNAKSIDVANLTQGIYILKITTKKGVLTNRFIKQ